MNNKSTIIIKISNMYYQTQGWHDQHISAVLDFLFENLSLTIKQQQYQGVLAHFRQLDMPAFYLLFALVQERLPKRAKMMFMAEDYIGKQDMLLEVMAHLVKNHIN
jgi:hypothetical protein